MGDDGREGQGRVAARRALTDALAAAVAGSGRLVLVTGEPGMGKTTLARAVADDARRAGAAVRWTACWVGGATVAHAPWLSVLAGLGEPGRAAVEALGTGGSAAGAGERAIAYSRVARALAAGGPAVVVLDDLHWADEGTLQLLAAVAGSLPGLPLLVVGAYRDAEVAADGALASLGASADRISLDGLPLEGVEALLAEALGRDPGAPLVAAVGRKTGGNPFLVQQLGRLLATDERGLDAPLPAGARDVLGRRLAVLDRADLDVLVAGAVLGSPFGVEALAATVGSDTDAVVGALGRAAAARVVERVAGVGMWGFVHDLFRQAALEGVAPGRRVALHRAAADALVAVGAEPAAVALHLLAAATGPDADAAEWSHRAGERALGAMAWEEAAGHFGRAVDLLPAGADELRARGLLGLGRSRLLLGDVAAAGDAFVEVAGLARARGDGPLLAAAALAFSADLSGFEVRLFDQRQIDVLEEAAAATGLDPALRARILARLSVALAWTTTTTRRLELAEEAVALARGGDDASALGGALAAHCDAIAGPADVERRKSEAAEVIAIGEATGDAGLELLGRRLRFMALCELGELAAAELEASAFARRADATGNPLYTWMPPLWRGMWACARGQLDLAGALADEAEAVGARAGSGNAPMLATVLRLMVLLEQGDAAGINELLGEMGALLKVDEMAPPALGQFAWCRHLEGRDDEATAMLSTLMASFEQLHEDAEWLPAVALALRAAAALRHERLAELLAHAEPYAHLLAVEGIGAGLHGPLGLECAAALRALGDHDRAVALARDALARSAVCGPLVLARAHVVLGDALAARGGPADAEEAAAEHVAADAAFRALGLDHPVKVTAPPPPAAALPDAANEIRRDGEVWHLRFAGTSSIVRHSKGMADLAALLAVPGREVHVTELEGVRRDELGGRGDDALDRTAVEAYRRRLGELAAEGDDADAAHDTGRAEKARIEYDALVEQLSSSLGLGGRARAAGPDPVERLRKAVTARVRDAIRRIDAVHPALGRHLTVSIRTGAFCSYRPEQPMAWRCQAGSGAGGA